LIVVNLFGGPGAGKSTNAAALFVHLKRRHILAELVFEEAKEHIYNGAVCQLQNQVQMACGQYKRLKDLERSGCQVAICDSPLLQNIHYAEHLPYYHELSALIEKVDGEFDNINVWIKRNVPFQTFGRTQKNSDEADTRALQIYMRTKHLINEWFDSTDTDGLCEFVNRELNKGRMQIAEASITSVATQQGN
jgi:nicotinamide riboside kinase